MCNKINVKYYCDKSNSNVIQKIKKYKLYFNGVDF